MSHINDSLNVFQNPLSIHAMNVVWPCWSPTQSKSIDILIFKCIQIWTIVSYLFQFSTKFIQIQSFDLQFKTPGQKIQMSVVYVKKHIWREDWEFGTYLPLITDWNTDWLRLRTKNKLSPLKWKSVGNLNLEYNEKGLCIRFCSYLSGISCLYTQR